LQSGHAAKHWRGWLQRLPNGCRRTKARTAFDDLNPDGSSIAQAKVSATMTPTPGVVISSRVRVSVRATPAAVFRSRPTHGAASCVPTAAQMQRSPGSDGPATSSLIRPSKCARVVLPTVRPKPRGMPRRLDLVSRSPSAAACVRSAWSAFPGPPSICNAPAGTSLGESVWRCRGVLTVGLDRHDLEPIAHVPGLQKLHFASPPTASPHRAVATAVRLPNRSSSFPSRANRTR
jgi:hypothetical protein